MATVTVDRTFTVELSSKEAQVVADLLDSTSDMGVETRQANPWLYNVINTLIGAYLESLPEANTVEDILRDFLDAVRHAVTLAEVNVAAGIALQRLAA